MRVITGSRRSIPLLSVEGMATRPTQDRIKETLFNMIQNYIPGCTFLDLYSGSGQMAIEALSRGAVSAVLVDSGREPKKVIEKNLEKTKFTEEARLYTSAVLSYVGTASPEKPFDIIYMDPPYDLHEENAVLEEIMKRNLLAEGGQIIVEARLDNDFYEHIPKGLTVSRIKDYKTNRHVFLRRAGEES